MFISHFHVMSRKNAALAIHSTKRNRWLASDRTDRLVVNS